MDVLELVRRTRWIHVQSWLNLGRLACDGIDLDQLQRSMRPSALHPEIL